MRYLLILAFFVIAVTVPTLTHRFAKRRVDEQIGKIAEWEKIPDQAERERCIWDYMRKRTRGDAMRWQLGTSLLLATVAFAAVSFWVIYDSQEETHDNSEEVAQLAGDVCRLYEQFVSDEAGDTSREIDVVTADIVRIQDAIDQTPSQVSEIPAYAEAPPWFREFLGDLLAQQVVEADARIVDLREDRSILEARESELEELLASADCPREAE